MAFVRVAGLNGKVYVPEGKTGVDKKHPCKDCYSCQMCSDDRCNACRNPEACVQKDGCNALPLCEMRTDKHAGKS